MRCQLLAQGLVNSSVLPTSQFSNKAILLRVASQMTDEEIVALMVLYQEEPRIAAEIAEQSAIERRAIGVTEETIASELGWKNEEVHIVCEGLCQLGLAYDGLTGAIGPSRRDSWRISPLATKLIELCINDAQKS